ncbi:MULTISPECIES: hypothetical protein [Burkholderiaceae]|uniref:hypothetical protein n=1 Tax=Burkholderiaceae TaxID=119060 RepID=UPI0009761714|nr:MULTISPECIES: hypothetical protein [Burkholderiaceae]MCG1040661.1 hypothetical protein [Mycetohabitans sp. B7]
MLRMRGAGGTIVPPSNVIAAAEGNSNISELDKWVLTTSLLARKVFAKALRAAASSLSRTREGLLPVLKGSGLYARDPLQRRSAGRAVGMTAARPDMHGYPVLFNEANAALYTAERQGLDR